MKRNFIINLVLLLTLSSASYALPISDKDNPHNMSNLAGHSGPKAATTLAGGTDRICVFCHTPHSAAAKSPLWNRKDSVTVFPLYGDADLAIKKDVGRTGYDASDQTKYPNGASRMCLSCHDGATSIGVLLTGAPIAMDGDFVTNDTITGIVDLSTSHPISFNYNADVVANVLQTYKPGSYQLPLGVIDVPLDGAGRMQCTTCHDPHEDTRGDVNYDFLPFWRHQGNATSYSDVCNDCHTASTVATPPPIHNIP